jgi:Ca2+-binding EF-hand superfamily protein
MALLRYKQSRSPSITQGKITTHELKRVAKELGEELADEEIEKIFAKADLDDDGFVTGDDFYNIITHKVYWKQLWT